MSDTRKQLLAELREACETHCSSGGKDKASKERAKSIQKQLTKLKD